MVTTGGAFAQRSGTTRGFASSWFGGGVGSGDSAAAPPPDLSPPPVDPYAAVEAVTPSALAVSDALCQAESAAQAVAMSEGWVTSSLLIQSMCQMTAAMEMPWWVAIMGITLSVRTALFPAMVWMEGIQMKLKVIQPELDRIKEKYPGVYQGDMASQEGLKAESQALFARHNMNPLSGLVLLPLGVTQLFVFGTFFFSLRYLSEAKVPSMMTGGALWFPDLTLPDPTFGLPILAAATMLISVEAGAMDSPGSGSTMKNAMRAMSVSFLLMGPYFPSSLFVYFISSNIFTVAQSSMMSSPAFRRSVGLPPRPKPVPGATDEFSKLWTRLKESGDDSGASAAPSSESVRVYSRKPGKARGAAPGRQADE